MSCGHVKSPFYTLQRLKDRFCGKDESAEACDLFYSISISLQNQ